MNVTAARSNAFFPNITNNNRKTTIWLFLGRVVFLLANSACPLPQGHPFIMQYNDGNAEVVSMWVCRMLEERRSTQGPQ